MGLWGVGKWGSDKVFSSLFNNSYPKSIFSPIQNIRRGTVGYLFPTPPPNIPLRGGGSNRLTIFSFHFDRVISLLPTHGNPFRHSRWNQSNISQVEINILRVKTIVIMFKSFNNTCKSIDKTCTSIVDMLKSTVHTFKSIVIMFKPIVNTCTSIVNKCKHIVTRATCKKQM